MRQDGRKNSELRPIEFVPGINPYAEGSCRAKFGATEVFVTATVERERPRWLGEGSGGWITAEYGMLPRATHTRSSREAVLGKQGGRTMEIQRLIGRALRAAVQLNALGEVTIRIDCDVLCADGGTRVASICGGWVALVHALKKLSYAGNIIPIAAISLGVVGGELLVDLSYEEDSKAEFDLNLVCNGSFELIEIQGTAERGPVTGGSLQEMVSLGRTAAERIISLQQDAVRVV